MLKELRGRSHQVITGVALVDAANGKEEVGHRSTHLLMRPYTDPEIEAFVVSGEAMDKAGAYALQDPVFQPAAQVEGCYANVVGLPLCIVAGLLRRFDVSVRPPAGWAPPGPCPDCAALAPAAGGAG